MSSPPVAPPVVLPPPLAAFESLGDDGIVFKPSNSAASSILEINNDALFRNQKTLEFLSVQSEMLVFSKEAHGTDEELHSSFEGITVCKSPQKDASKKYRVDVYDSDEQRIIMCPNKLDVPVSVLFAHEMTHAIDDSYDDRRSGDRTAAVLKFRDGGAVTDHDFQKSTIELAASTFAAAGDFIEKYSNPVFDKMPFVAGCESGDKDAANLSLEFTSFGFETLYHNIAKYGNVDRFIESYKGLCDVSTGAAPAGPDDSEHRKAAQEVIAVALYDVNDHMIKHIRKIDPLTTERGELLGQLVQVQQEIEPAYMRSIHKVVQRYQEEISVSTSLDIETAGKVEAVSIISERVKEYGPKKGVDMSRTIELTEQVGKTARSLHVHPVVTKRQKSGRHPRLSGAYSFNEVRMSTLVLEAEGNGHSLVVASPIRREVRNIRASSPVESTFAMHIDEASRMRDSLTRAEAESGGKAKYGDLKRTMSPIRRRPATVLGGRM